MEGVDIYENIAVKYTREKAMLMKKTKTIKWSDVNKIFKTPSS